MTKTSTNIYIHIQIHHNIHVHIAILVSALTCIPIRMRRRKCVLLCVYVNLDVQFFFLCPYVCQYKYIHTFILHMQSLHMHFSDTLGCTTRGTHQDNHVNVDAGSMRIRCCMAAVSVVGLSRTTGLFRCCPLYVFSGFCVAGCWEGF